MRRVTAFWAAWAERMEGRRSIWVVSLSLILICGFVFPQAGIRADAPVLDNYQYYRIIFDKSSDINRLAESGIEPLVVGDWGAYLKITPEKATGIPGLEEMSARTIIHMEEQGLDIDTAKGYDLPAEWRKADTQLRLVQFVCPASAEWLGSLENIAGPVLRSIGDSVVVVRMDANIETKISTLECVEWTGPYEPRFKVYADLMAKSGDINITVTTVPDSTGILQELEALGASNIEDSQFGCVNCRISSGTLRAVAALDSVLQVTYLPEMKPMSSASGRVVQAQDLWVNTVSNLPQNIMGEGQIVHVQDSGIDGTHRDFTAGPLGNRILYAEMNSDPNDLGHGTYTTGIVAGNGYDMEAYLGLSTMDRVYNSLASSNPGGMPDRMGFAGRAPEASIVSRAGYTTTDWAAGYTTFGARIFSNSWGGTLEHYYVSDADVFMRSNPSALVVFAAGNSGPGENSVTGYGNGKLVISAGAFENTRPVQGKDSDDPNQVLDFSSRGPVDDGRIKPDLLEVGYAYGPKSDDIPEIDVPGLYNALSFIDSDTMDINIGDYRLISGTSSACAAVSGDAVLVRDYLQDVRGIPSANIHANLIKTLLIHGAEDMGYGYPSFDQGWGRVNVRNSICPAFPNVIQWYHHNTGIASGSWNARTDGGLLTWVTDPSVPLKISMAHWDTASSGVLSYDLDLVVTSPSGVRYEGNAFSEGWSAPITNPAAWSNCRFPSWMGNNPYDWDTADDGGDDINNIEMFRILNPEKGQWDVQVVWKSYTAQPFTLAMTGGFNASADVNAPSNAYRVSMSLDRPRVVPERDDFGEAIFTAAPSGSVAVPYWLNNGGTTNDSYTMSAPVLPSGFTVTYAPASPVSLNSGKRVHGFAVVSIGFSVVAGTYTIALKALSTGDSTAPIAQSLIKFQFDVQTSKTPPLVKIADSPVHEDAPTMVSWNSAGIDYIGCAYRQDGQFGSRVYFKLSSDGGRTWSTAVPISAPSWSPGFVTITRATSGSYVGRLAIAYNAWNPSSFGGDSTDTRNAYVKIAYADSPYTTWTEVNAWSLGTGVSVGNTYRTVNINWVSSVSQFYLTVECLGYTDTISYISDAFACIGKSSSDGGATWSVQARIDLGVAGMYYFFPHAVTDILGNLAVWFYERDSSDSVQDRDLAFRYYNGAWGSLKMAWDTTDNVMFAQGVAAPQGINGNRNYCAVIKGANTDGDRQLYLVYTDDAGTTFVTGYGPYGPVVSDQDYGTRFLMDGEYTDDGYVWWTAMRLVKYDPFTQPNIFTVRDNDYSATPVPIVDYITLNSYVKGKQRTVNISEDGGKLLVAWNQMTADANTDIFCTLMDNDWQTAPDTIGPIVESIFADKPFCNVGDTISVTANLNDWSTGGSNIAAAQYRTDVDNATFIVMQPLDGSFNSPAEAVKTISPISTFGWSPGWHWIFVRGQDSVGNWGEWVALRIYVNPAEAPSATVIAPTGTSNVAAVTILYLWTGYPTSVNLYYTKNTAAPYTWVLIGSDPTTDGSFAYTIIGGSAVYGWKASAVGVNSTDSSPPLITELPEAVYVYDIIPPAPPTDLTVDNWGPSIEYSAPVTETRYLRQDAVLGLTNSAIAGNWGPGNNVAIYLGAKVYKRSSLGVETEISSGLVLTVSRTAAGSGYQTATWTPPVTSLDVGDSIVLKIYGDTTANPTTLRATFTTEQLGPMRLDANQWTIQYWTRFGGSPNGSDWYWGTVTYDNHISGFMYTPMVTRDPFLDNTLNWSASVSGDVDHYNIYRAAISGGPYTLIGTSPVGTNTYLDSLKGIADATNWWYNVRAVDDAGNEETNNNNVPEYLPGLPYKIDLTGKVPNSWVFVSFPDALSGNIQTILNDAILGDGMTTWSIAKWYNPQTPADLWKTYRVGSTTNDLANINSQVGVWLWLTANGGDQHISLGMDGSPSAIPVVVNLYAGWNMVGYPSETARLASVTLPATTDMVSVWQAASPYILDYTDKSLVTMSHGNGYWIYVTADCVWTVNP